MPHIRIKYQKDETPPRVFRFLLAQEVKIRRKKKYKGEIIRGKKKTDMAKRTQVIPELVNFKALIIKTMNIQNRVERETHKKKRSI